MNHNEGQIVEIALKRHNINISELSKQLNVNRRTLYNWFRQKKLRKEVISKIENAIHYDFSEDFEIEVMRSSDYKESYITRTTWSTNVPNTAFYWMEKYTALLEDYRKLMRKRGS